MITDAPAYHPGAVSDPEESEYLCYVLMRKEAAAKPGARGYPICFRRNRQTSAPSGVTWTFSAWKINAFPRSKCLRRQFQ